MTDRAKPYYTTLTLLKKNGACRTGYHKLCGSLGGVKKYGHETPITFTQILGSNGLNDCLWALRAVCHEQKGRVSRLARIFACDCAEHVLPLFEAQYPEDNRPREAIKTARRFAEGGVALGELSEAWDAAWDAAEAAAFAASSAWDEQVWQTQRLRELLEGVKI